MDNQKTLNKSDARILMSNAVCYALIALHDDKELQEQVNSILFNDENELIAKKLYIQHIMFEINNLLVNEYVNQIGEVVQ